MNKLNTLLVIPRYKTYGSSGHYVMPMGTLYISAYLKKSCVTNVYTLNLNHEQGDEFELLARFIDNNNINIIGIGGLSGEYQDLARMASYARKIKKNITIIIGGGILTADPQTTMIAIPEADYGIVGEGERVIVDLINVLTNKRSLDEVKGIIFWRTEGWKLTLKQDEIIDLDTLPLPDYKGFKYEEYLEMNPDMSDEGKKYSQVSVIGGRSCKYNCTFCFHPSGTTYRQRSLDSIFTEIDYLVENYNISYIALREELFATDNRRVADFCRRVEKYNFDWSIQLRIDSINQELVDLLSGTRCRYVFLGVESANDTVLKSMRKGITRKQIEDSLEMLRKANLNTRSAVIFGDSIETKEYADDTLKWFIYNKNKYRIFADMIIAFPGSVLYKRACRNGVIPDPVQFLKDGCPIVNVSKMDDKEFTELISTVSKLNNRYYNLKNYLFE